MYKSGEQQHQGFARFICVALFLFASLKGVLKFTVELLELKGTHKGYLVQLPALNRDTHSSISAQSPSSLTVAVCRDGAPPLSVQPVPVPHHPNCKQLLPYIQSK